MSIIVCINTAMTALVVESRCQGMCTCMCFQHWKLHQDRKFLYYFMAAISSQIYFSGITFRFTDTLTVYTKSDWLQHLDITRTQQRIDFPGLFWKQFGRQLLTTKTTTEKTIKPYAKTEKAKRDLTNCIPHPHPPPNFLP